MNKVLFFCIEKRSKRYKACSDVAFVFIIDAGTFLLVLHSIKSHLFYDPNSVSV